MVLALLKKLVFFMEKVTISENFLGYKVIDKRNESVVGEQKNFNARNSKAHAFWIEIENNKITESALRAVENMFRVGSVFVIPADRHDTSTYCDQKANRIYFYENYSGGIGISEKALGKWRDILKKGMSIAEHCTCNKGCPKCIHPPRLKETAMIDKKEGLLLASEILEI